MKIDISQVLHNFHDEKPFTINVEGKVENLTLKKVLINSLGMEEKGLDKAAVLKRYDFALRVLKAEGEMECSVEEVALVQKLVIKTYPTLIAGQAHRMLEPKEKKK